MSNLNTVAAIAFAVTSVFGLTVRADAASLWVDNGANANWEGNDIFYSDGALPKNQGNGVALCDDSHRGAVAVCWNNRPEDPSSRAAGVPTDIKAGDKNPTWCAYKSTAIKESTPPGPGPNGRVFVCSDQDAQP